MQLMIGTLVVVVLLSPGRTRVVEILEATTVLGAGRVAKVIL